MKLTYERLIDLGYEEDATPDFFWYTKSIDKLLISIKVPIKNGTPNYKGKLTIEVTNFGKKFTLSGNPTIKGIYRGYIKSMGELKTLIKMLLR